MFQQRFKKIIENATEDEITLESLAKLYNCSISSPTICKDSKLNHNNITFTNVRPTGVRQIPTIKLVALRNPNGDNRAVIMAPNDGVLFTWEWDDKENTMKRNYDV